MAYSPWYVEPDYWLTGYAEGDGFLQLNAELQKVAPSAVIELFQLELNAAQHGVSETYYFHAGANATNSGDVIWNGQAYLAFPIEATEFEYTGTGSLPRPKLLFQPKPCSSMPAASGSGPTSAASPAP